MTLQARARAHPNIALIKYWGNAHDTLRLPLNASISMNLESLFTETTVHWQGDLTQDMVMINGGAATSTATQRVSQFLDHVRQHYHLTDYALVESTNNFPMGAGIASSASAFAALALAATAAAGLYLDTKSLSTLARLGSGSAARSVPSGFVEWHQGQDHETSYAESLAAIDHWHLKDVIAVVDGDHKQIGSSQGHTLAATSDLLAGRLMNINQRLHQCRQAILQRDFDSLADVVERDSHLMHAVMMTSTPSLFYWTPASVQVMDQVRQWRNSGIPVCYTLDAGPNVHCICESESTSSIADWLDHCVGVKSVYMSGVGEGATIY